MLKDLEQDDARQDGLWPTTRVIGPVEFRIRQLAKLLQLLWGGRASIVRIGSAIHAGQGAFPPVRFNDC